MENFPPDSIAMLAAESLWTRNFQLEQFSRRLSFIIFCLAIVRLSNCQIAYRSAIEVILFTSIRIYSVR